MRYKVDSVHLDKKITIRKMPAKRLFTKKDFEKELNENILDFWTNYMVDHKNGGFYGRIDNQNQVHHQADKGLILNARILWTYSAAYQQFKNPNYLYQAKKAFNALQGFRDLEYKGMCWMLDCKGQPVDTKKQIYAQAFALYGLSEYYKISQKALVMDMAIELYQLIEKHSLDEEQNGYLEAFDRRWNLLDDLRLSEKDVNEAKTMNTHLHILEAYTTLYQVWKNHQLKQSLRNLIQLFLTKFLDSTYHFKLFFDESWNLKSKEISYGHDIEASWLIHEAALTLGDKDLIQVTESMAVKVTEAVMPFFDRDGGLFNAGIADKIKDTDKHWWPQAEALVGLYNAYQITKDIKYLNQVEKTWEFIQQQIIDHKNGEWFWGVKMNGELMEKEDKAGPWKCPYHNGRAMIELIKRL